MSDYDLVDFILENDRWKRIGPLNQIKDFIYTQTKGYTDFSPTNIESVRRRFKNVGSCTVTDLSNSQDFEQLTQYYLPWYSTDTNEQIRFSQYVNHFMNANLNLIEYDKIAKLVQILKESWNYKIEIIIAFDTIKEFGVIVDGTHHSLALYAIKQKDDELLEYLLKSSSSVNYCIMNSSQSRVIFYEDFKS